MFTLSESAQAIPKSYDEKKQVYQRAIDSEDIGVLNEFIEEYQGTGWDKTAKWHRDKLAVEEAKNNGSVGAMNTFLDTYPDSAWYNHGVHFRDKSAYRQAKLINTIEIYDEFLKNYPASKWQEQVKKRREKLINPSMASHGSRASKNSQVEQLLPLEMNKPESAEVRRNKAALAIYDDIRQQKNKEKAAKKKAKEKQLAMKRYCHKVKDQIRRIDEGRRWYRLNDQGERTFLSDLQIDQAKQKLIDKNAKRCELKVG